MKKENECAPFDEMFMGLAHGSLNNRIALLTWLDALYSNQKIELPYASSPLAPTDEVLICLHKDNRFSVCLGGPDQVLHSFTAEQWRTKITLLMNELVKHTPPHSLDELPPSLRRLILWRPSTDGSSIDKASRGPLNPTRLNSETAYFYRLVWQHYRADSVHITATERVCFLIGHDYTERLGMRSGAIRQHYDGSCLVDTSGRTYRFEERTVSRLKADGSILWSTEMESSSLHQGVFSTGQHVAIPDLDTIRCLDAHDGHLLWSASGEFNVIGLQEHCLIVTAETEAFELLTLHMKTGEARRLLSSPHHLVDCWWRAPYGVYFLASEADHEATQLLYLDSRDGTTHQYSLAPCRPKCGAAHSAGFSIVLESEGRQLLCEVALRPTSIRLTALSVPHSVEDVIHVQDNRMVLLTTAGHMMCIDRLTQTIYWQQLFGNTPLERLRKTCVHESHLLIPSTPPQILHLRTGEIIGTIDSKLYEHAIPVLVSSNRLMLKDDYGYVGLFELSGFIAPARPD